MYAIFVGSTFSEPQFVVPHALSDVTSYSRSRTVWRNPSRVAARSDEKGGA